MERIIEHKLKNGTAAVEKKPVGSELEQERAGLLAEVFDIMVSMPIEEFTKLLSEVANNGQCVWQ